MTYHTHHGLEKLNKEYQELVGARERLRQTFLEAWERNGAQHAEDPDPSYLAFLEDMEFLNARIEEYGAVLRDAVSVSETQERKKDASTVGIGARVVVEVGGQNSIFLLVGAREADPAAGEISPECPVGRAVLGRRTGDSVTLRIPSSPQTQILKIKAVSYPLYV